MEPNILPDDVIAKAPATERKPVLSLAGRHTFQLLNIVPSGTVIRVRERIVAALFSVASKLR